MVHVPTMKYKRMNLNRNKNDYTKENMVTYRSSNFFLPLSPIFYKAMWQLYFHTIHD